MYSTDLIRGSALLKYGFNLCYAHMLQSKEIVQFINRSVPPQILHDMEWCAPFIIMVIDLYDPLQALNAKKLPPLLDQCKVWPRISPAINMDDKRIWLDVKCELLGQIRQWHGFDYVDEYQLQVGELV